MAVFVGEAGNALSELDGGTLPNRTIKIILLAHLIRRQVG